MVVTARPGRHEDGFLAWLPFAYWRYCDGDDAKKLSQSSHTTVRNSTTFLLIHVIPTLRPTHGPTAHVRAFENEIRKVSKKHARTEKNEVEDREASRHEGRRANLLLAIGIATVLTV